MGREERRMRQRVAKQLRSRLGREPTDEEITDAFQALEATLQKEGRRRRDGTKPRSRPFAWKQ